MISSSAWLGPSSPFDRLLEAGLVMDGTNCQKALTLLLFHAGEASTQCHAPNHSNVASSHIVWSPWYLFVSMLSDAPSWSLSGTRGSRWARAVTLLLLTPCFSALAAYHGLVLGSHLWCLWGEITSEISPFPPFTHSKPLLIAACIIILCTSKKEKYCH